MPLSRSETPAEHSIAVVCSRAGVVPRGEQLARVLSLPFLGVAQPRSLPAGWWLLVVDDAGLAMQQSGPRVAGPVMVDFVGGKLGFRRQRQEATPMVVKAVGVAPGIRPRVWDLTAGLGQDAFVLAKHGCPVTLFERHPIIHALLADGLDRARRSAEAGDEGLRAIVENLSLTRADSIEVLSALDDKDQDEEGRPEVVYIDTMFPERSKSAEVKKGMQLFQSIVGEDPDAAHLLDLALQQAKYRTAVKRPRHAPHLGQREPNLTLSGKSVRFDVYTRRKMEKT